MSAFDANLLLKAWLNTCTPLVSLVGAGNIYGGSLPEGFSCEDETNNKALVIRRRGGKRHGEIPVLHGPSFVVEGWALEEPDAAQVYATAADFMHGSNMIDMGVAGVILIAQEEVEAADAHDPATHWPFTFGYWRIVCRPAGT